MTRPKLGGFALALALALAMVAPAGCSSAGNSPGMSTDGDATPAAPGSSATGPSLPGSTATAGASTLGDIPAGRSIAEGGGGPLTYTFREEWRRARAEAQNWRGGAFLISASGPYINDDGVPSYWTFAFADKTGPEAVLIVEIDPWGKVTETREVTGEGLSSFVSKYTDRIPYEVLDSDTAVGLGKAALADRYDLAKTKDPRIGLNFSATDGSGPYWSYTLFYKSTAVYVTAKVHAITGSVTLVE